HDGDVGRAPPPADVERSWDGKGVRACPGWSLCELPHGLGLDWQPWAYAFTYPSRAGSSDGAAVPWSTPSPAVTRRANMDRPCCRQVAPVRSRSANGVMPVYTGTTPDENRVAG